MEVKEDFWNSDPEVAFERLGDSTRMSMPEESYHQELLGVDIPLSHRIAHLIPFVETTAELFTVSKIAKLIGSNDYWVGQATSRIGVEPVVRAGESNVSNLYPSFALQLLEEEWRWHRAYEELDDMVSLYETASFVGREHRWVSVHASELSVYPVRTKLDRNREVVAYPKTLIPMLRHIILVIPPAEDWSTAHDIAERVGQKQSWVQKQLDEAGFAGETRRLAYDGREFIHYPPEAIQIIQEAIENRAKPAGDWLNVGAMAVMLDKDHDWVRVRVEKNFLASGESRQDDNMRTITHYPPHVFDALREEVEVLRAYPDAGGYLAVTGLARAIGKTNAWVNRRLPHVDIEPEVRLDRLKRPFLHYPPHVAGLLQALPEDILRTTKRP